MDKRNLEEESADPEFHALREQLNEMKQTMVLLRGERDAVWDELQQVRQELRQTQESQLNPSTPAIAAAPPSLDPTQVAELETLRRQVRDQQQPAPAAT